MAYVKPQVQVFQEFSIVSTEITEPLRAHISGPNAKLHRYDVDSEKALINVGPYDHTQPANYAWPDRTAGSLVDTASVKLMVENALLLYFSDLIGDTSNGRGTVVPASGRKNWVRSNTVSFVANGTAWPRSGLLNDRDVAIGDVAYIRGVSGADDTCQEHELWTTVAGFAADEVAATVFDAYSDTNNQGSVAAATTIQQTDGPINCVSAAANGASYNGLPSGYVTEKYTIEVTKSSISGCNAARLRVISDSGTDNVDELTPADFGSPTAIGTRGLTVTFSATTGDCSSSAASEGVAGEELVVGQVWEVVVTQAFERVCADGGDTYTGPSDDTYIIEVTKGGTWAELPAVTVTTVKGLDSSGPTTVSGINTAIPVGVYGMTIMFKDCGNLSSSSSSVSGPGSALGIGDDALAGLRKGDKFYISVVSGQNGPIRTLILSDDLPAALRTATDLDLRLFINKDLEVTKSRLSQPPLTNYSVEATQLITASGITAYDPTWTKNGVEQALPLWSGVPASSASTADYGTLYIEYREWLPDLANTITFIDSIAELDLIPGQLDEMNPLKWGAFRALQNSNGTRVAVSAVVNPDNLDSWNDVLERISGRDDIYNLVPLTYNREVQGMFASKVDSESDANNANWKAMFVNLQLRTTTMRVGRSSASAQLLTPTSTNGDVVLATLEDNPEAVGTQYTLLSVPANNSGFIRHGVAAGDVVRYLFTIDSFGESVYQEFVVDRVLSETSLLLLSGHTAPISVPQKVEIWHTLTKNEMVEDLVDQAQSFASSRVVAVWPDIVGTGGNSQDGIYLAAALAGLASGVAPHRPLTNVEIAGFDDLASRSRDFFSAAQLDALAGGGVWIATEDRDGTPHTRHAVTTDTLDLNRREEMVRRNVDSISYLFRNRLRPYIGRVNVTDSMLRVLRYQLLQVVKSLQITGVTAELGPQLIAGVIATDVNGAEIIKVNPLATDRVEIVMNLTVPAPLNNIALRLVI